ncbi:MAG: hypothetical protein ABR555_07840 [Pyrinomonadaceae bacterium]
MLLRKITLLLLASSVLVLSGPVLAQTARTPSETVREFYKAMRERRFRDAFAMSIYKPAIEGLNQQEFEDLKPDFEKMAVAVSEKLPASVDVTGEQVSGDSATVFVKVIDSEGKQQIEPASLMKLDAVWILGDKDNQALVKKAGKQFFFNARIEAHHGDVQEMLTRIALAQVVYNQQHNNQYGNLAELIAAGLVPKDLEGPESTGYIFHVTRTVDGKTWYASSEPVEYGRTGRLSFFLDSSGVRSGDVGGKPLVVKN